MGVPIFIQGYLFHYTIMLLGTLPILTFIFLLPNANTNHHNIQTSINNNGFRGNNKMGDCGTKKEYAGMNMLSQKAPVMIAHHACPNEPYRCHGLVQNGKCIGSCELGEGNSMSVGEAVILSATRALRGDCSEECCEEKSKRDCQKCIYKEAGLSDKGKRSIFGTIIGVVKTALNPENLVCAASISTDVAGCVSTDFGNVEGIVQCVQGLKDGVKCGCHVLCSIYKAACSVCMALGQSS